MEILDLTKDNETECGICLEHGVYMHAAAVESMQCNMREYVSIIVDAPSNVDDMGCGRWFHRHCLEQWHNTCTKRNDGAHGATCPLCRRKNTFIWSFTEDYGMSNCLFIEDFLQMALISGNHELSELKEFFPLKRLSMGYLNKPEMIGSTNWANSCRKIGGIVASCIVGNDLRTLKYFIRRGAYVPRQVDAGEKDVVKEVNPNLQSLLMLAVRTFEDQSSSSVDVFQFLLKLGKEELVDFELEVSVVYPHHLDAFLLALNHNIEEIVKLFVHTRLLRKFRARILLQYLLMCPKFSSTVFGLVFRRLEQCNALSMPVLDVAIEGCAKAPFFPSHKFETVLGFVPLHRRSSFLLEVLCNSLRLREVKVFRATLLDNGEVLSKLDIHEWVLLFETLGESLAMNWSRQFDLKNGCKLNNKAHTSSSFNLLLKTMFIGYPGDIYTDKMLNGEMRKVTHVVDVLITGVQADLLTMTSGFRYFNPVELLMIMLRAVSVEIPPTVVHEILYQIVENLYRCVSSRKFKDVLALRSYIDRIIAPIVAYCPEALNPAILANPVRDVVLYTAYIGLPVLFECVFDIYPEMTYARIDAEGRTPLHLAVLGEQPWLLKYWGRIATGMDINAKDKEGSTALMMAMNTRNAKIGGKRKRNPLTSNDLVEVVKRLLAYENIDTKLRNKEGLTAVEMAESTGHYEIAFLIETFEQHR